MQWEQMESNSPIEEGSKELAGCTTMKRTKCQNCKQIQPHVEFEL